MSKNLLSMHDIDMNGKKVLIRVDLNVPMENGIISNDARIRAILPTLLYALEQNAAIILLSHLGRPKEGNADPSLSLEPIAKHLSLLLNKTVRFEKNWLNGLSISPGEIILCENVRFNIGEIENDPILAKKMSTLGDIFVMDAFATAHRDEASTTGIAQYAPIKVAGPLLLQELNILDQLLKNPKKPLIAIVGGSKVSSKIDLLNSLLQKVDVLIVGGGIANTFLAATGVSIGNSLYEPDKVSFANMLLEKAKTMGKTILMPVDVVVAQNVDNHSEIAKTKTLTAIDPEDKILDIGPKTLRQYQQAIKNAASILWNGPVGVFENSHFELGTKGVALAIAHSDAYSIAGGGDTIAAIEKYAVENQISYISTGGGAFLSYLEGKSLPAVAALLL